MTPLLTWPSFLGALLTGFAAWAAVAGRTFDNVTGRWSNYSDEIPPEQIGAPLGGRTTEPRWHAFPRFQPGAGDRDPSRRRIARSGERDARHASAEMAARADSSSSRGPIPHRERKPR